MSGSIEYLIEKGILPPPQKEVKPHHQPAEGAFDISGRRVTLEDGDPLKMAIQKINALSSEQKPSQKRKAVTVFAGQRTAAIGGVGQR